jgi:hypothetical protein
MNGVNSFTILKIIVRPTIITTYALFNNTSIYGMILLLYA